MSGARFPGVAVAARVGSLRTTTGTSGCGCRLATSSSTSRLFLWRALAGTLSVIVWREMRRQQSDGRQREGTVADVLQDDRKPSRGPGGLDAVVRRVLRQVQRLRAVGKQRREPLGQIEPARIELDQEREKACGRASLSRGCTCDRCEQFTIRQMTSWW